MENERYRKMGVSGGGPFTVLTGSSTYLVHNAMFWRSHLEAGN